MCQTCSSLQEIDIPPWLWDPTLILRRKKENSKHSEKTCTFQTSVKADPAFIDEVVTAHNNFRSKHQAAPLTHSEDLTTQAQKWADHLAATNTFQHSFASLKGERLGENIAMKWSSMLDTYSGQEVTEQWYSEIKFHEFGKEPKSTSSGHFTQVVWRGSREIGVGKSKSKDGKILVVTNYRPAGNVLGSFIDNVLPCSTGGRITNRVTNQVSSKVPDKASPPLRSCRTDIYIPRQTSANPTSCKTAVYIPRQLTSRVSPDRESRSRSETEVRKQRSTGISNSPITASTTRSKMSESRSVRTFTETTGSGANKVTKTVVEETIIKADGTKVTNRKETVTTGDSGGSRDGAGAMSLTDSKKKDKDSGGAFSFFKGKDKKRGSSSSSDSSPERPKKPQNIKEFIDDCVKVHNTYRKKHGVPPLKHAKDLSTFAQKWAEHLAATNSFQHSDCNHKGDRLGENIACKWSSGGGDYTGQEVCDQWYSEIKKHDFGTEPRSLGSGHFTQMVWKSSKEVGVGKAKTTGGKVIVVASYRPAGNLVGSFKENVPPPK